MGKWSFPAAPAFFSQRFVFPDGLVGDFARGQVLGLVIR